MDVNIKRKRLERGLTQVQFAEKVGVLQSTVAMWETGKTIPMASKLPTIAKVLECNIDDLFAK